MRICHLLIFGLLISAHTFSQKDTSGILIQVLDKETIEAIPDATIDIVSLSGEVFEGRTDKKGQLMYISKDNASVSITVGKVDYLVAKGNEVFDHHHKIYYHEYFLIKKSGCRMIPILSFQDNSLEYDGHDSLILMVKQIMMDNPSLHFGLSPSIASSEDPSLRWKRGSKVRKAIIEVGGDEQRIHVYMGNQAVLIPEENIQNASEDRRERMEKETRSVMVQVLSPEEVEQSKSKE